MLGQGTITHETELPAFLQDALWQLEVRNKATASWLEFRVESPKGEGRGEETILDPRVRWSDTDGGVFGVRFFNAAPSSSGRMLLISPTSMFVWLESKGVAKDFRNEGAVRGHVGFHAAWPMESLEMWTKSEVDHSVARVKALVKGYGDLVLGEQGWRSERLTIVSLQAKEELARELSVSYPDVNVIVGTPENILSEDKFQINWAGGREYAMGVVSPRKGRGVLGEFKA